MESGELILGKKYSINGGDPVWVLVDEVGTNGGKYHFIKDETSAFSSITIPKEVLKIVDGKIQGSYPRHFAHFKENPEMYSKLKKAFFSV